MPNGAFKHPDSLVHTAQLTPRLGQPADVAVTHEGCGRCSVRSRRLVAMTVRPRMSFLTDPEYAAAGRRYCAEDIYLAGRLGDDFAVASTHPDHATDLMEHFDIVVVRNTGPVTRHQESYDRYRARASGLGIPVFTELSGRADQAGKQYLVDLWAQGYPVMATVDSVSDLEKLPEVETYVVKPKFGADSVGMRFVSRAEVGDLGGGEWLIQPKVDFEYEVSFYFVDHDFQYALYAPSTAHRWELEPYEPSDTDLAFSQRIVDWNTIEHGIQRVDACRAVDGTLQLVELEDLNPYLSLDRVTLEARNGLVDAVIRSVRGMLGL
ncbi:hypothetical protein ACQ7HM_18045 [Williamsia sp. MIQD14]|uniref:hypothetical protein n=1 Tax=Williamsia sp. MIQD14 TaxID=3425703 RepID=UPI003DA016DC